MLSVAAAEFGLIVAVTGGQVRGRTRKRRRRLQGGTLRRAAGGRASLARARAGESLEGRACRHGLRPPRTQSPQLNRGGTVAKEDCLYLNVWTPEWPSRSKKPVMVWVPGGGNYFGSGLTPTFDGDSLARQGVVLVTINYRLGSLGFFSHPALTRELPRHASGNQGILDQIIALKWVRNRSRSSVVILKT